jgi:hypothetical protein
MFFKFVQNTNMTISEIQFYELLSSKIGRHEAQGLVTFMETKMDQKLEEKTMILATKDDIKELKQEIHFIKSDVANVKVDLIKWMVGTGIALSGVMVAVMVGMIKFLHLQN